MSDIYINGIEMPKEGKRALWVVIHPDGTVEYNAGDGGWLILRQSAISIPPHGRLIDADTAEVITYTDEKGDFVDGILFAAEWIANQPTIIPADTIFTKKEIYEYRNN